MASRAVLVCPCWGPDVFVEIFTSRREPSAPAGKTMSGSVYLGQIVFRTPKGLTRSGGVLIKAFSGKDPLRDCVREASVMARANGWPVEHDSFSGPNLEAAKSRLAGVCSLSADHCPVGGALSSECLDSAFDTELSDRADGFAPRLVAYSTKARYMFAATDEEAFAHALLACQWRSKDTRGRPVLPRPASCCLESVAVMQGLDLTLARLLAPTKALARDPLSEEALVRPFLAPAIMAALSRCHHAGIGHLDIKPDNMAVHISRTRGTARIVLIDFGLSVTHGMLPAPAPAPAPTGVPTSRFAPPARVLTPHAPASAGGVSIGNRCVDGSPYQVPGATEAKAHTTHLGRCGTREFIAPELLLAQGRAGLVDTRRADVFSACCSLAQVLTGRAVPWSDAFHIVMALLPQVEDLIPLPPGSSPARERLVMQRRAKTLRSRLDKLNGAWYDPISDLDPRSPQPDAVKRGNCAYVDFCRDASATHSLRPGVAPIADDSSASRRLPYIYSDDAEQMQIATEAANEAAPPSAVDFRVTAMAVRARQEALNPPLSLPGTPPHTNRLLLPTFAEYLSKAESLSGSGALESERLDFFMLGLAFAGRDERFLYQRGLPHELLHHAYIAASARMIPATDGLANVECSDPAVLLEIDARMRRLVDSSSAERVRLVTGKIAAAMSAPRTRVAPISSASSAAASSVGASSTPDDASSDGGDASTPTSSMAQSVSPAAWSDRVARDAGSRVAASVVRSSRLMRSVSLAAADAMRTAAQHTHTQRRVSSSTIPSRDAVAAAGAGVGAGADAGASTSHQAWHGARDTVAYVHGSPQFSDSAAVRSIPTVGSRPHPVPSPVGELGGVGGFEGAHAEEIHAPFGMGMSSVRRAEVLSGDSASAASAGSAGDDSGSVISGAWKALGEAVMWVIAPVASVVGTPSAAYSGPAAASSSQSQPSGQIALATAVDLGGGKALPAKSGSAARSVAQSPEKTMLLALRKAAAESKAVDSAVPLIDEGEKQWTLALKRTTAMSNGMLSASAGYVVDRLGHALPVRDACLSQVAAIPNISTAEATSGPDLTAMAYAGAVSGLVRAAADGDGVSGLLTNPIAALSAAVGSVELLRAPGGLADAVGRLGQDVPVAMFAPVTVAIRGDGSSARIVLAIVEPADTEACGTIDVALTSEASLGGTDAEADTEVSLSSPIAPETSLSRISDGIESAHEVAFEYSSMKPARPTLVGVPSWCTARLLALDIVAAPLPTEVGAPPRSVVTVTRADDDGISRSSLCLEAMTAVKNGFGGPAGRALGFWGSAAHQSLLIQAPDRGFAQVDVASKRAFEFVKTSICSAITPLAMAE